MIASNIDDAQNVMMERSKVDGDAFRIRIYRRASPAAPPESVAIFDDATVSDIMNPEPWLSRFAGGSPHYFMRVVHMKDATNDTPIAMFQAPAIPGPAKMPDRKVMDSAEWHGPRTCIYAAGDQPSSEKTNGVQKRSDPAAGVLPVPRQPESGDGGGVGLVLAQMRAEIDAQRAALDTERRAMEEKRHRDEIEALRRSAEEDRKRFEERMNMALERNKSVKDPIETFVPIIAAIGTAIGPVLSMLSENRKLAREEALRREERIAAREAKSEDRQAMLLEKLASAGSEQAKVMAAMSDVVAQTMRSNLQTTAMMRELNSPEPPDEGLMGVIKAAIGAWVEASARSAAPAPAPAVIPPQFASPPPGAPNPNAAAPQPSIPPQDEGGEPEGEVTPGFMLDRLAEAIGERTDPGDLASDVAEALTDSTFVEAIKSEGGLLAVLSKRLPAAWGSDQANATYVRDLAQKIVAAAQSKGVPAETLAALFK